MYQWPEATAAEIFFVILADQQIQSTFLVFRLRNVTQRKKGESI